MSQSTPLFSPSLIDEGVHAALPSGFTIRPLARDDYAKGFLECLRDLTWTGNQTAEEFAARYDEMDTQGKGPYYYLVIEHEGRIVGTGAVIIEKKLCVLPKFSYLFLCLPMPLWSETNDLTLAAFGIGPASGTSRRFASPKSTRARSWACA